ncbi:HK97 family phage prohead protease [Bradyrhizobium sp. SZCCHNRI2049]|uniref:HK97 family phage prohead protease n=1 Tax=Bradyrhizobium sp. SZCCHNRI2049 TaxID=3057287 RepID=UPI0029170950|nr:HK97 family phage prohead protease [Bradyrhizobium sp. SZCCHNRI2049]
MTLHRKAYAFKADALAEKRQVVVVCSTSDVDRSGEIVVQNGIDLSAYLANPVVLADHDPTRRVARAIEIGVVDGNLSATVQFPPAGEIPHADVLYNEVKNGLVNTVSIGFTPLETEPLDKANPKKGPQKYLKSELLEFSFVGIPANKAALIVARNAASAHGAEWKVGASRNLDIDLDDDWDAEQAADSIFDKAAFGDDDCDMVFVRKGFLAYNPQAAEESSAYLLPFAQVKDGRLIASRAGLKAARTQLATMTLPADVAAKAAAVLDHYEAKMQTKAAPAPVTKTVTPIKVKSLYDIAQLAYALGGIGCLQRDSAWEAEYEGDGSQVPAMLAEACRQLADALIAMTQEEVAEMLATLKLPEEADAVAKHLVAKGTVKADAKPLQVALAVAGAMAPLQAVTTKAGRKFSAATEKAMREACKQIADGHAALTGLLEAETDEDSTSDTDDEQKSARQARLRKVRLLAQSTV